MLIRLITITAVTFFLAPVLPLGAQEHPTEHPTKKEGEHPEHPEKGKGQKKDVTMAEISSGIKNHIETKSKSASDGKFHAMHEGKDIALTLVKVHEDRLQSLGGGKYFACVDMKAADGTTYDIDFFLTGKPGDMRVTETSVHKVNGKPLYNWKEENGNWKKVSTG
jgi:hypothetical protein